ncbi:hypothetical protein [Oceanibaculum nanhaiense]|uniref:hypothetical protein n=1 Tax=Oceanibaculum nanhaiense TaxID=1909734 RepID=UPI003D2C8B61
MKIEIDAARLARALSSARAVTASVNIAHILNHCLLVAEGETLRLKTSNFDMTAEMTLAAHVLEPGQCTAPAAMLAHALSCVREGGEVRIEKGARDRVIVRSGRNRHEMLSMDPEAFGGLPDIAAPVSEFIAPLHEWLGWASPAAGTGDKRPEQCGVWLSIDRDRMVIAASDGFHGLIRRENMPLGADKMPDCFLPNAVVSVIGKLFSEPARVLLDSNRLDVTGDGVRLSAKLGDVRRPPFERAFERKEFDSFTAARADLQAAIKAVLPLTTVKDSRLEVLVSGGQLRIACRSDLGEIATSDADIENPPSSTIRFATNPRHLVTLLAAAGTPAVRVSISTDPHIASIVTVDPVDGWDGSAATAIMRTDPHIDLAKVLTPEALAAGDMQEAA